jgi:pilus assembly protein CpaB
MKNFLKSWGLLLAAAGVGLIAFFAATSYLTNAESKMRDNLMGTASETVEVVVAGTDIRAGTTVNSSNLAIAQLPSGNVSGAGITPDMFADIDGALLNVNMKSGEPLLTHFLVGALIERFSDLLDVGQRAVTIEVDNLASNSGLLSVGDYVDIFVSGDFPSSELDEDNKDSMVPLFENVRVLAADRNPLLTRQQEFRGQNLLSEEEGFEFASVTLALDSQDAGALAFAATMGDIVFLLRSPEDDSKVGWDKIDSDYVLDKNRGVGTKPSYSYFGKSSLFSADPRPLTTAPINDGRSRGMSVPIISAKSVDGVIPIESVNLVDSTEIQTATDAQSLDIPNEDASAIESDETNEISETLSED